MKRVARPVLDTSGSHLTRALCRPALVMATRRIISPLRQIANLHGRVNYIVQAIEFSFNGIIC